MSADATVVRKRGRPKKVVAPSNPEVSLPEASKSSTTKKKSVVAAAEGLQEAGSKTNGRKTKVAGNIEGATKVPKVEEVAREVLKGAMDAGTSSTRSSKSGSSGLKADETSAGISSTTNIKPYARVEEIQQAITELQKATLELEQSAQAPLKQASVSTIPQPTEPKPDKTSSRLQPTSPIDPHARVEEIANAVIELQRTTLELERSAPASPKQTSSSTNPQITESKPTTLSPPTDFNIPIIPTPPFEELLQPNIILPTSSTATHPTPTPTINIPIIPIPPLLEERPHRTILLPHASTSTSNAPAHQPPIPTSKILTTLAAALAATQVAAQQQSQIHSLTTTAATTMPTSPSAPSPSSRPSRSNQPHPPPRAVPKRAKPPIFTGLPPTLPETQARKNPLSQATATAANPKTFKTAYRKWTMVMVALPIAFVTSWVLFERLALGKEQRRLGDLGDQSRAEAATTVSGVAVETSER